eukprot:COSAG02_NODE_1960_length_10257_cov_48.153278_4_plen_119_part_00
MTVPFVQTTTSACSHKIVPANDCAIILPDVPQMCLTSKSVELTPVNEYQREAYAVHQIAKRDPMYATMFVLKDVEEAGSLEGLRQLAQDFDVKDARRRSAARFAVGADDVSPSDRPKL